MCCQQDVSKLLAISRTTRPNSGLFTVILLHFPCRLKIIMYNDLNVVLKCYKKLIGAVVFSRHLCDTNAIKI